jgi:hypothetical protein
MIDRTGSSALTRFITNGDSLIVEIAADGSALTRFNANGKNFPSDSLFSKPIVKI